jgi:hypothetical protein
MRNRDLLQCSLPQFGPKKSRFVFNTVWEKPQLTAVLFKLFFCWSGLFTHLMNDNFYYRCQTACTAMKTLYYYSICWPYLITWKRLSLCLLTYWKLRLSVRYIINLVSNFLYTPYVFSKSFQIKETSPDWMQCHSKESRASITFYGYSPRKNFLILS